MAVDVDGRAELDKLYTDIERSHMAPLWNLASTVLPREPASRAVPFIWRRQDYWPLCRRAGRLVPIDRGGDRRVLAFINPGLGAGRYATTHTLWAAVQYLEPGETAPDHRHSPAAIRFILQGRRGFTTVEDDKCMMERGDLILTPPGVWHGHGHEGDTPMLWMDGLDIPLVQSLEAGFFDAYDGPPRAWRLVDRAVSPAGQFRTASTVHTPEGGGLLVYRWADAAAALRGLASSDASPYDDVVLEYVNPFTGGSVLPTLGCRLQRVRAGVHTRRHRHVSSAVYHVFSGQGYSVIDGHRFDWGPGDFFCVPTWAWHEHANEGEEDAILFSLHDTPVMTALGLYREQAA